MHLTKYVKVPISWFRLRPYADQLKIWDDKIESGGRGVASFVASALPRLDRLGENGRHDLDGASESCRASCSHSL